MQSVTKGIVSEETNFVPLELLKNAGKTPKSSVPVLSAGPLYFQLSTFSVFPGFFAFLANCVSYLLSTFYALLTDGLPGESRECVARVASKPSFLQGKQVVFQQRW